MLVFLFQLLSQLCKSSHITQNTVNLKMNNIKNQLQPERDLQDLLTHLLLFFGVLEGEDDIFKIFHLLLQ